MRPPGEREGETPATGVLLQGNVHIPGSWVGGPKVFATVLESSSIYTVEPHCLRFGLQKFLFYRPVLAILF